MIPVAFYDTKPYDREFFPLAAGSDACELRFLDFRLTAESAPTAAGSLAVCAFVNDRLDRPCLEILAGVGVRHVALRSAGFNHVDLKAAESLGLAVSRVPAYSPHAVAEHTIALLMALNRKIHRAYNRVREHNFSLAGLVGFDVHGKTVSIVGTGKIGKLTAQIFRGFGAHVLAHDATPDPVWAAAHDITYGTIDELLAAADILSLHIPLLPETHHLINGQSLAKMKPGSHLVNTSRGKLVDTAALIAALKSRHLGGVALDVYEEEEGVFFEDLSGEVMQDDELTRLLTFPNVLITSHQAFLTREALQEIARVTMGNIVLRAADQPLLAGTQLA